MRWRGLPKGEIIQRLVIDRNESDVVQRTGKGFYHAADLNRVSEAALYLQERLRSVGYVVDVKARTNWTREDIPVERQTRRYLDNIVNIKGRGSGQTLLPESLSGFTWRGANAIEALLCEVDRYIEDMRQNYPDCGDAYGGE